MEGETVIAYKVTQNDDNGYKAALEATMTGRSGVVLPEKPNDGGSINTKYDTEAFTPSPYAATSSYAETVTPEKDAEPEKRTMTCFAIDVNKKANTFALSIPEAGFTVGGSFKVEDDKTTIEINSLTADGETMDKGWALTIIIDESDEMPAIVDKNAATNFFDLTKGNLVDITDRLEKEFGEFFKSEDAVSLDPNEAIANLKDRGYTASENDLVSKAYKLWGINNLDEVVVAINPNVDSDSVTLLYFENEQAAKEGFDILLEKVSSSADAPECISIYKNIVYFGSYAAIEAAK